MKAILWVTSWTIDRTYYFVQLLIPVIPVVIELDSLFPKLTHLILISNQHAFLFSQLTFLT
jgi:hypothetical protein